MCHKTAVQNAQIDRFVENGMPQKIVKTVRYTLKKRAAAIAAAEARARADIAETDVALEEQTSLSAATLTSSSSSEADDVDESDRAIETPTPAGKPTGTVTTADLAAVHVGNDETTMRIEAEQVAEREMPMQANVTSALQMPAIESKRFSRSDEATTMAPDSQQGDIATQLKAKEAVLKIPKMCGRFRKLQQQQQQQQQQPVGPEGHMDALAKGTQMTKRFTQRVGMAMEALQSSHLYTFLTKTTQPAHVIVVCILAFVLLTVWPNIMDGTQGGANTAGPTQSSATVPPTTSQEFGNELPPQANRKHPLAVIAYLGAFATHFGAQIWMTFVSGLSLYFSLPRHTFGQCQQILFPKYFALNATLSISMLILYVKYMLTTWSVAACAQMTAVAVCAVVEVTVRLYLAPPMLRLMHEKYKIEGSVGSGTEVGSIVQGDLVQCPHYQRVHKTFRRIHMAIAIGNMIVLTATCLHLYFIAAKIQIS